MAGRPVKCLACDAGFTGPDTSTLNLEEVADVIPIPLTHDDRSQLRQRAVQFPKDPIQNAYHFWRTSVTARELFECGT